TKRRAARSQSTWCRICVQGTPLVVLGPLDCRALSGTLDLGWTCDGRARRTHRPVGDPHPEGASPAPEAVLRDPRHRAHALRSGGDSGEARAEGWSEEGASIG